MSFSTCWTASSVSNFFRPRFTVSLICRRSLLKKMSFSSASAPGSFASLAASFLPGAPGGSNQSRPCAMNDVLLSAKGLHKTYLLGRRELKVLRGVDVELKRGDFLGLR